MLDLAKKIEVSLGSGVKVSVGVLSLRKMKELEPLMTALLTAETDTAVDAVAVAVDAIHAILIANGNQISKAVIDEVLTVNMIKTITEISYGKHIEE